MMATQTIYPRPDQTPTLPSIGINETKAQEKANDSAPAPDPPKQSNGEQYRLLSHDEWVQFCHGIGVFKDAESETVIRPTCWYWPPKGVSDGLFQDTLAEKTKFTYWFHMLSTVRWILMILQIAMSAVLTALGSLSAKNGTAITAIAAVNTCSAGVLALMHNSGLPDRYRSDRNEFHKLEEYLKAIIDTRLVSADDSIIEVLAECWERFQDARQTVQNNIPASYTAAPSTVVKKSLQKTGK